MVARGAAPFCSAGHARNPGGTECDPPERSYDIYGVTSQISWDKTRASGGRRSKTKYLL